MLLESVVVLATFEFERDSVQHKLGHHDLSLLLHYKLLRLLLLLLLLGLRLNLLGLRFLVLFQNCLFCVLEEDGGEVIKGMSD